MIKHDSPQMYIIICLLTAVVTCAVCALALYIRSRRYARFVRDAERARYMEKLEKERNFYRLQWQMGSGIKVSAEPTDCKKGKSGMPVPTTTREAVE